MKVLVCGGRNYDDVGKVWNVLNDLHRVEIVDAVVHGGASGADHIAGQWAAHFDVREIVYYADWKVHGRAAGPIRNQRMLDEEKPDAVIAFPGGRGTDDMVRRAKAAGVRIIDERRPPHATDTEEKETT